jgi:hypothetical protein
MEQIGKHLVSGGSGFAIGAFIGALTVLEEKGYKWTGYTGVSGSSALVSMMASGMPLAEIKQILYALDVSTLMDRNWLNFSKFGYLKGKKLREFVHHFVPYTFEEVDADLNIVATELTKGAKSNMFVFNKKNTPKAYIADAVRCSASIPYLFDVAEHNIRYFIDGGWVNNCPVDMFPNSLALKLVMGETTYTQYSSGWNFLDRFMAYNESLLIANLKEQEKEHIEDALYADVIKLKTSIHPLDLDLTPEKIDISFQDGKQSVFDWLNP